MTDYKINFDGHQYWIGKIVRDNNGQALFVQQVSEYTTYRRVANRWLKSIQSKEVTK